MKIKTKNIFLGLSALLLGTTLFASAKSLVQTKADAMLTTASEIKSEYIYKDIFDVPEGTITIGEVAYKADEILLIFPDGTVYSQEENYTLNQTGKYTVVYSVTVDGKTIKQEKNFVVKQTVSETEIKSSTFEYIDAVSMSSSTEIPGLQIGLKEGDTFTYNKPIDLTALENGEFLKIYPYNRSVIHYGSQKAATIDSSTGNPKLDEEGNIVTQDMTFNVEAENYTIRLTDCYDKNNYVEFLIRYGKSTKYLTGEDYSTVSYTWGAYLNCRANGQTFYGLTVDAKTATSNSRAETFIDGVRYTYRTNGTYGVSSSVACFDNVGLALSYDTDTNCGYLETSTKKLINKLDNPEMYGDNLFKGFTTGEVYLSITADTYRIGVEKANFDITKIGNDTGEALIGTFADTQAPKISVDVPNGAKKFMIAKGESFSIFDATAWDVNLVGKVKTQVYYEYGTLAQSQVGIKNGTFVPINTGTYTIVYTAKDSFGNEAKETITLNCTDAQSKGIVFGLLEDKPSNMYIATSQKFPAYTVSGLNDEVNVRLFVKYAEIETELDISTREFIPMQAGEYEVIYRYSDGIKAYEYSFTVNCLATDILVLKNKPIFPKHFIYSGDNADGYKMKYSLDEVYVCKYTDGEKSEHLADMYVSHDGGEYQKITDYNCVEILGNKTVQFKVEYDGQTLFESEKYTLINVGDIFGTTKQDDEKDWIYIDKYFVGDFSSEITAQGVSYQSNKTDENQLEFVNLVSQSNFTFSFTIEKDFSDFETMTISLIDYYDRTKTIDVTYTTAERGYYVKFNDGRNVFVNGDFVDVAHKLSISGSFFSIIGPIGTQKFETWESFTTDKTLLQISFKGIEGDCKIQINELCGTTFSSYLKTDKTQPNISVATPAGTYGQNEVIDIFAACATDVLTPFIDSQLYVELKNEEGEYISSTSGVVLNGVDGGCISQDYQVVLGDMGKYTVIYYAIDQNGLQTAKSQYIIYIADMEAPELTLKNGYEETTIITVQQGETVEIVGYSVSDNNGMEGVRVITTITDSDNYVSILDGKSFKATKKGLWKINYYARDEKGNYVLRYYFVNVV